MTSKALHEKIEAIKCKRKRKFATQTTAETATSGLKHGSVYKCRHCGYWHITTKY